VTTHERDASPAADDEASPPLTAGGEAVAWLRRRLQRTPSAEEHQAVVEIVPDGGPALREYAFRFSALTALAAAIAGFGLLADSGAVVIGAMLVAPLMTPITAVAAALVLADNVKLLKSMALIVLGVAIAFAVGIVAAVVAGQDIVVESDLPGEVVARTFPKLVDLAIAIAAGAAAGYIAPRRSTTGALPGVGIAVALVPPLATSGICAFTGFADEARNAFLLFLTNFAAIVFAAAVMLILAGFRPHLIVSRARFRMRLAVTLAAVVIVAFPLSLHTRTTIEDSGLRRDVALAVEDWSGDVEVLDMEAEVAGGTGTVDLLVAGPGAPPPAYELGQLIAERFDGPIDLRLEFQSNELFVVSVR
jgi:uncharacterized hydrophobic protein (TIGR00271 family)